VIRRLLSERPALGVGAFTVCWAAMEMIAPATGLSPYEIVWSRYGVHLVIMLLLLGRRQGFSLVRTKHPALEVLASLLMLGMPMCFVLAAQRMPLPDTISVFWTAPALIVAFVALLGQQLGGARTIVAIVVGLIGAVLICKPDAAALHPAAILAMGMSACFALYVVLMGSIRGDAISTKLFHTAAWVFVILSFALPRFWRMPSAFGVVGIVIISVLGLGGLYLLDAALETTSPAMIAPVFYMQVAIDPLLHGLRHWQKYQQLPDRATLIGMALVFAVAVQALLRRRVTAPAPAIVESAAA
jgi:hypothetical protein